MTKEEFAVRLKGLNLSIKDMFLLIIFFLIHLISLFLHLTSIKPSSNSLDVIDSNIRGVPTIPKAFRPLVISVNEVNFDSIIFLRIL